VRPEDLKRWVADRSAAEVREKQEWRAHSPSTAVAVRSALSLMSVVGSLQGWPPVETAESRRDDDAAQLAWMRLRIAMERSA
jgi:hypothetical protein